MVALGTLGKDDFSRKRLLPLLQVSYRSVAMKELLPVNALKYSRVQILLHCYNSRQTSLRVGSTRIAEITSTNNIKLWAITRSFPPRLQSQHCPPLLPVTGLSPPTEKNWVPLVSILDISRQLPELKFANFSEYKRSKRSENSESGIFEMSFENMSPIW